MTDNALLNYSMAWAPQSILKTSGIEWSALRNHVPCIVHEIQHCLGALMSKLQVKESTKSWKAHKCDLQFGESEGVPTTNIQKLW
jgi:hypothetical protein